MIDKINIEPIADAALAARLQSRLDAKTKPRGSLGRLESLALQIGLIQRSESPALHAPQLIVFAADHGLAARGVSAYPSDVTWQMVENFLGGGAAVSVLARLHGLALQVVDAGVAHAFEPRAGLISHKIAFGTADSSRQPAMSDAQCERAIAAGRDIVRGLPGNALLLGEMGIGNTSAASLLLSRLAGVPIDEATGRGTGLDDAGLDRKRALLREVLALHADAQAPLQALAAFGGFEIAMMVGAALQAASERRVVVVDGFIAGSAILVAQALAPAVVDCCVFAHRSDEAAHGRMLAALQAQPQTHAQTHAQTNAQTNAQPHAQPLLDLGLRLGEGSGAALAWPLLQAALALLDQMATFDSASVSTSRLG